MAATTINTRIKLKKDTEANFNKVATTFIPLDGEVCIIETSLGVRVKIGDGVTAIGSLAYIDTVASGGLAVEDDDCLVFSKP